MNIFKQARNIIRNLNQDECFSIQRCYSVPAGRAFDTHRDLIIYKKDGCKVGRVVKKYKFRTHMKKRMSLLESLRR